VSDLRAIAGDPLSVRGPAFCRDAVWGDSETAQLIMQLETVSLGFLRACRKAATGVFWSHEAILRALDHLEGLHFRARRLEREL
jgi:hypothetical protein